MKWPHSIGDDFNAKKPSTNNLSEKVKPLSKEELLSITKSCFLNVWSHQRLVAKWTERWIYQVVQAAVTKVRLSCVKLCFKLITMPKSDTCLSMTFRLGLSLNTCDSPGLVSKWVRYDWGATRGHYELLNWMESLLGNTSHNHTRQNLHKQKPSGHNLKVHNTQWTQIPQKTEPS